MLQWFESDLSTRLQLVYLIVQLHKVLCWVYIIHASFSNIIQKHTYIAMQMISRYIHVWNQMAYI